MLFSLETGGLLRLAVKLMQEASSSNEDYVELVNLVGIHFQVRDDYMNMQSQKVSTFFCLQLAQLAQLAAPFQFCSLSAVPCKLEITTNL